MIATRTRTGHCCSRAGTFDCRPCIASNSREGPSMAAIDPWRRRVAGFAMLPAMRGLLFGSSRCRAGV